ncbi:hypothetical protein DYY67_1409 [Candidatus Nitrosotalea sp. TS]|nr:hypothetical protein [Candidatus Nitrosotalea sp. TS]
MSYQDKIICVQGGGGGNLVAVLCEEIDAWDLALRY